MKPEIFIPIEWAKIILSWDEVSSSEGQGLPDKGMIDWIYTNYPELKE
jgi:hypothetical protein